MTDQTPTPMSTADVERVIEAPWRVRDGAVEADFATGNMVNGGRFVARAIEAAEAMNHHPDIDLRYGTIHFALSTHSVGGVTQLDVDLAGHLSQIARDLDAEPA